MKEATRNWQEKNLDRFRELRIKWQQSHPNWARDYNIKRRREKPELIKSYKRKYYRKNPSSQTEIMTKYRRSHKECEWLSSKQNWIDNIGSDFKSLHVHHILPKFRYTECIDGDYHGRIGNNFICYCPFHHYAYHFVYSTIRNDKKHQLALGMLWTNAKKWADNNKISIEDLEIELAGMLP